MKNIKVIYWIFTILLALGMLIASIPDLFVAKAAQFITAMGYPAYIIPFLSIAKILAAIAILIPGYPRIKEWAYAGIAFDLIGATYSQIALGIPIPQVCFMLIWFAVLALSYIYHHKKMQATVNA